MKLSSHKTLLGLIACFILAMPLAAQTKIGTIDLKKVFDGYWKTKQADTQLKDRASEFDTQRKEMIDSYQAANEEYRKLLDSASDQAVSSEERDRRKTASEDKLRDIKQIEAQITQFDRTARTTLDEQRRRMRDSILREIQEVVNLKARAANYTIVWDTAAESVNNTPVILYTNGENDLTNQVLTQLNATAPPDLKPAEQKPPSTSGRVQ